MDGGIRMEDEFGWRRGQIWMEELAFRTSLVEEYEWRTSLDGGIRIEDESGTGWRN